MTSKTKKPQKPLEWMAVDPDIRRTYPPEDQRYLFKRKGGGYEFFYGVHDGYGTVRSLLRRKGRELIVCTLRDIEAYAVDGSTDPYGTRSTK